MKKWGKTVVLSCAVWAAGIMGATSAHAYPSEFGVKVQVNDQLVAFADAQPYIDGSSQLLVPVRPAFEKMGYRIEWSKQGEDVQVTVTGPDRRTLRFTTGSKEAVLNGKPVSLPTPALLRDGATYAPVRALFETLGYMVQWDDANGIAIICQDGRYHAPAWYAPQYGELIETAKRYIGTPYVWGGTSPEGFDCSGFVNFVFDLYGIELPRTSRQMYDRSGQPVTDLKAGDLVFFNTGRSATHVGIYLGNDEFISATSSRGIQIDSLSSAYWSSRYIGAKRVI